MDTVKIIGYQRYYGDKTNSSRSSSDDIFSSHNFLSLVSFHFILYYKKKKERVSGWVSRDIYNSVCIGLFKFVIMDIVGIPRWSSCKCIASSRRKGRGKA